jgi:branched-subunit amino acid ABC-type transport system permease component
MQLFLEFTFGGIAFGMIYAAIALSLVLIWRGTRILNFSQGGMAMFTTYIAVIVINHTGNYWAGFAVALAAGIVLGAVVERVIIVRRAGHARGPGRDHLRRPVPLVPAGFLGDRAEGRVNQPGGVSQ